MSRQITKSEELYRSRCGVGGIQWAKSDLPNFHAGRCVRVGDKSFPPKYMALIVYGNFGEFRPGNNFR